MDEQCETSFVAQEGRRIDFWLACMVMYREPWCSLATYQGVVALVCVCACVCVRVCVCVQTSSRFRDVPSSL